MSRRNRKASKPAIAGATEALAKKKSELEIEKLQLETSNLRSPIRRNPALWVTAIVACASIATAVRSSQLSKQESLIAELSSLHAKLDRDQALMALESTSKELAAAQHALNSAVHIREKLQTEIMNLNLRHDALLVENLCLTNDSYIRSINSEVVPMPKAVTIRQRESDGRERSLGNGSKDLVFNFNKKGMNEFCSESDVTFHYASETGDTLYVHRRDYTDHISWTLNIVLNSVIPAEISLSSQKEFAGNLECDHPFEGYPSIVDNSGREFVLRRM